MRPQVTLALVGPVDRNRFAPTIGSLASPAGGAPRATISASCSSRSIPLKNGLRYSVPNLCVDDMMTDMANMTFRQ
jgi:hypothetical protein